MCGIIGHVATTGSQANRKAVEHGCQYLRHRGPDGSGVANYAGASFGHRRLSIIDLELSQQPWVSPDKRFTLIFNGEIYNYVELREDLINHGCTFTSNGDTEVLLQMYLHYGLDCLNKFNGMFSFAIWDDREKSLLLARDRLGKKPLYFAEFDGGIAFASEIGALREFREIDFSTDLAAAHDYFAYQFIPDERSIHRGIQKLLPAHYLRFCNGISQVERYWSIRWNTAPPQVADLSGSLRELINDAVRIRLRSDVPLGAFLSGGLDSSIILQSMRDLGADIQSYTIGFKEKSYDESSQSRRFAEHLQVSHHEKIIDFDPLATVQKVSEHLDEPFADPSSIPTWLLCGYASESVTVALSGDGADELFGGYQRYRAMGYLQTYRRLPVGVRRRLIEPLVGALRESGAYYGGNSPKKLKLFLRLARRMELSPNDLLPQVFDLDERRRILDADLVSIRANDHVEKYGLEDVDPIGRMMLTDIHAYLSEDILTKVDRMSMAHGLEVRSPLLDHRIVEFACALGNNWKIHDGTTKYLLRHAYRASLPNDILRRKKHGFDVPIGAWFRHELKDLFADTVINAACPSYLKRSEIIKIWDAHQKQRGDYGVKLWTILVYYLWLAKQTA